VLFPLAFVPAQLPPLNALLSSAQELCVLFNSFSRHGFAFILITKNVKNKRSNLQCGNATVAPPMKFTRFQGILYSFCCTYTLGANIIVDGGFKTK